MGRFKEPVTIVDDKLLKGNLFEQLDAVMQLFQQYLQVRIEVGSRVEEGKSMLDALRHKETWDFPLDALREAVINALIHRDYFDTSADIQIRVFDDRILIANPGGLPEDLTVEDLKREYHPSQPRNPLLAQVFYYAELIEKWGSGTWRMAELCRAQGMPGPEFASHPRRFEAVFNADPYTEERLRGMGLNDRQVKAVLWLKRSGKLTNQDYQQLTAVKKRQASEDLAALAGLGLIERTGTTGRGTYYVLKGRQRGERGTKGAPKGRRGHGRRARKPSGKRKEVGHG